MEGILIDTPPKFQFFITNQAKPVLKPFAFNADTNKYKQILFDKKTNYIEDKSFNLHSNSTLNQLQVQSKSKLKLKI